VVLVEQGEVEKRIEKESDNIDVQAIGYFLIRSGYRQELMSSYLDGKGVCCGDIKSARCDRCSEGEQV
jgi:hypothetical protein